MKNKNIHPIYFNSFVGTWKRVANKGNIKPDYLIVFNSDCTYEEYPIGTLKNNEGTVNGDVDEVSVEEEHQYEELAKKGNVKLSMNDEQFNLKFRLSANNQHQKMSTMNKMELSNNHSFEIFELEHVEIQKKKIKRLKRKVKA